MKRNGGFTLIEVMVAIVLLGALVVPVSTGMVMTLRMNEKTEDLMQAQLAVSSAVETLMASGISSTADPDLEDVDILITEVKEDDVLLPYYNVKVTSEDGAVVVNTTIRKAGGQP